MHSRLAEYISPYRNLLSSEAATSWSSGRGLALVNRQVSEQAAMIAYNNDFKLIMVLTIGAIPLVALLRRPRWSCGTCDHRITGRAVPPVLSASGSKAAGLLSQIQK
jgi:DHA2 family multidrug resistance protein